MSILQQLQVSRITDFTLTQLICVLLCNKPSILPLCPLILLKQAEIAGVCIRKIPAFWQI